MTKGRDPAEVGYDRPGFLTRKDRYFLRNSPEESGNAEKRHRIRQRTRSAFRDFALLFERLPERDRELIFGDYTKVGPLVKPAHEDIDEDTTEDDGDVNSEAEPADGNESEEIDREKYKLEVAQEGGLHADGLHEDVVDTLSFICLGLAEQGGVSSVSQGYGRESVRAEGHHVDWFEDVIRDTLDQTYPELDLVFEDAYFEITSKDMSEVENLRRYLLRSFERETVLPTGDAVRRLIEEGGIDKDALKAFLQKELEENESEHHTETSVESDRE